MKYKELFTPANGLFAKYVCPFFDEFQNNLFQNAVPEELDGLALFKYGNRTLSDGLTADTASVVIKGIV